MHEVVAPSKAVLRQWVWMVNNDANADYGMRAYARMALGRAEWSPERQEWVALMPGD